MSDDDQAAAGDDQASLPDLERDQAGRFKPGRSANPAGRPKGIVSVAKAKNLRDLIIIAADRHGQKVDPGSEDGVASYLEWLAAREPRSFAGLLSKLVAVAPIKVDLPSIGKPSDLPSAAAFLANAVATGEVSPADASAMSNIFGNAAKIYEVNALANRIERLEAQAAAAAEKAQP